MKHANKFGRCILDKDIKFVKKLLNKKPISFSGRYFNDNDCVIKVVGIRKYAAFPLFSRDKTRFCYEVDVVVKLSNKYILCYSSATHRNTKIRRYKNERLLREELAYFNMDDIQISKITFEK
jgi:hypothetical protein